MTKGLIKVHRKGYRAKRGRTEYYVKPTTYWRKDVGKPGKGPELIRVKPGRLKKYGYSTSKSWPERKKALLKADKAYGSTTLWRMLNAQVIFRKRTDGNRKIFEHDRDWVMENLMSRSERRRMVSKAVKERW